MQTFIIESESSKFIKKTLSSFRQKYDIDDLSVLEFIPKTTFGISDVRQIIRSLTLKTYGGLSRIIVLYNAQKATIVAQNALLKLLEEPPQNTFIFLVVASHYQLLPTILSRVFLISNRFVKDAQITPPKDVLLTITGLSSGNRLLYLQNIIKTKEDALNFATNLISNLNSYLISDNPSEIISRKEISILLSKTIKAKKMIDKNINFKATLDILLLGFPLHS